MDLGTTSNAVRRRTGDVYAQSTRMLAASTSAAGAETAYIRRTRRVRGNAVVARLQIGAAACADSALETSPAAEVKGVAGVRGSAGPAARQSLDRVLW